MNSQELDALKLYLRVETDEDDGLIESLWNAAQSFAETQTGKLLSWQTTDTPSRNLYELAIKQLVSHWYENRAMVVTGTIVTQIPLTVQSILNHIALCGDFNEPRTTE